MELTDNLYEKDRKQDVVYSYLIEKIIRLEIQPGQYINEGELVTQLSCSRTPVREAIQRLISEKILISLPGKGTYVSKVMIEDILAIYDFRSVLDSYVIRLCYNNITNGVLDFMEENLILQLKAIEENDMIKRLAIDKELIHYMLELTSNDWLKDAVLRLLVHTERISHQFYLSNTNGTIDVINEARYSINSKTQIFQEMRKGNVEKAEELTKERWQHFKKLYFDLFKKKANI